MNAIGRILRSSLLGLALAATAAAAPPASAPAAPAAEQTMLAPRPLVEWLAGQALAVLRDPKLSPDEKTAKIEDLAYSHIDFQTMSRLVLGRNWAGLTPQQQTDFIREFKQHLTFTYANLGRDYKNQDMKVTGDRALDRGDWLVQSQIVGDNNLSTGVDYRLRQKEGQWYIVDLMVEGQSMVLNFRAQFDQIIQQGGIDQLIKDLHEKNAAGKS